MSKHESSITFLTNFSSTMDSTKLDKCSKNNISKMSRTKTDNDKIKENKKSSSMFEWNFLKSNIDFFLFDLTSHAQASAKTSHFIKINVCNCSQLNIQSITNARYASNDSFSAIFMSRFKLVAAHNNVIHVIFHIATPCISKWWCKKKFHDFFRLIKLHLFHFIRWLSSVMIFSYFKVGNILLLVKQEMNQVAIY